MCSRPVSRSYAVRIAGAVLVSALLLGCQEYRLSGKDDPPGGTDSDAGTTPSTGTDDECSALDLPLAEPLATASPTCSDVDVSWEVIIEADFDVPGVINAAAFAPFLPGELPDILVCRTGSGSLGIAAIDPQSGAMRSTEDLLGDCASFAWAAGTDGTAVGALAHVMDPPGLALTADPGGPWTVAARAWESLPVVADLDQDGTAEVLYGNEAFHADAEVMATFGDAFGRSWMTAADVVDGDALEVVAPDGVYNVEGERIVSWPAQFLDGQSYSQGVFPVRVDEVIRYFAANGRALWAFDEDGSEMWERSWAGDDSVPVGGYWAVGEANGDGRPDMCLFAGAHVVVVDIDGEVLLEETTGDTLAWNRGGCALSDLDADGNDEVVTYDASGIRVYDVASRSLLAHRPDICSTTWQTPPAIADVDEDGSGEIVVVGQPGPCTEEMVLGGHVYVLGPAEGRWARTRPVWNQLPYDPALIADDGTLGTGPEWSNRFRSQPSRDGERPDLSPELVDVCADDCETGSVWWSVRVRNSGSADASEGTQVVLASTTTGEIAVGSIPAPIPAGWASEAIRLEAGAADLLGQLHIEVRNGAISECDSSNDRLDLGPDVPCAND